MWTAAACFASFIAGIVAGGLVCGVAVMVQADRKYGITAQRQRAANPLGSPEDGRIVEIVNEAISVGVMDAAIARANIRNNNRGKVGR